MLTYLVLCITAYLVLKILRAPRSADATGYLLVSGLIPLPVYMIGRSVNAGVFPIDVCLLAYIVAHGLPALDYCRRTQSTIYRRRSSFWFVRPGHMFRRFQCFICRLRPAEILCIYYSEVLGVCALSYGPDCEQTGCGTTTKNLRNCTCRNSGLRDPPRVAHQRYRAAFR